MVRPMYKSVDMIKKTLCNFGTTGQIETYEGSFLGSFSFDDIYDEAEDYDLLVAGKVGACAVQTHEFSPATQQKVKAKGLTVKFHSEK